MMDRPQDGFEFLEELRNRNGKEIQNFKDLSRYLDSRAREKGIPIYGQFELTPLCNLDCRMCYVHLNREQLAGKPILPVDTWKDLMKQACEAGMLHATLTGGECLTYSGFEELYLFLQNLGCDVSIMTNGALLDEKRIGFLKAHKPARIQITLYGWNDDVYERVTGQRVFSTVAENIRKAVEANLPVTINVTPSSFLGEDVLETIRVGKSFGKPLTVNSAIFTPREETGRAEQKDEPEVDLYIRIYQLLNELDGVKTVEVDPEKLPPAGGPSHECAECGMRCGGGRSAFAITWEGKMMACNRMDMIHADALKEGIATAWHKVNREASSWPRVPECEGCPYDGICTNCTANMLRFADPGKQPMVLCERTKKLVQHGVWQIPDCE